MATQLYIWRFQLVYILFRIPQTSQGLHACRSLQEEFFNLHKEIINSLQLTYYYRESLCIFLLTLQQKNKFTNKKALIKLQPDVCTKIAPTHRHAWLMLIKYPHVFKKQWSIVLIAVSLFLIGELEIVSTDEYISCTHVRLNIVNILA